MEESSAFFEEDDLEDQLADEAAVAEAGVDDTVPAFDMSDTLVTNESVSEDPAVFADLDQVDALTYSPDIPEVPMVENLQLPEPSQAALTPTPSMPVIAPLSTYRGNLRATPGKR